MRFCSLVTHFCSHLLTCCSLFTHALGHGSPGSPDGYLLVDENDSWGEQNLGQPPNLINPNQPIAWLTRLFTFRKYISNLLRVMYGAIFIDWLCLQCRTWRPPSMSRFQSGGTRCLCICLLSQ